MNITTSELKNHLDAYLDMAETSPVIVEKKGKIRLAIISYSAYERIKETDTTGMKHIFSPRLLHPEKAADFTKEIIDEEINHAVI